MGSKQNRNRKHSDTDLKPANQQEFSQILKAKLMKYVVTCLWQGCCAQTSEKQNSGLICVLMRTTSCVLKPTTIKTKSEQTSIAISHEFVLFAYLSFFNKCVYVVQKICRVFITFRQFSELLANKFSLAVPHHPFKGWINVLPKQRYMVKQRTMSKITYLKASKLYVSIKV